MFRPRIIRWILSIILLIFVWLDYNWAIKLAITLGLITVELELILMEIRKIKDV